MSTKKNRNKAYNLHSNPSKKYGREQNDKNRSWKCVFPQNTKTPGKTAKNLQKQSKFLTKGKLWKQSRRSL